MAKQITSFSHLTLDVGSTVDRQPLALAGAQLYRARALPCSHITLSPTQAPGPKVSARPAPTPTPHLPCHLRFSRDGHTDAEDAIRAPGTRGSLAIARGSSHSRLSSCQRTEPTCQAQPLRRAQLYSQRSVRARAPETPPAQQSPAHVQAARQSEAGAIS